MLIHKMANQLFAASGLIGMEVERDPANAGLRDAQTAIEAACETVHEMRRTNPCKLPLVAERIGNGHAIRSEGK